VTDNKIESPIESPIENNKGSVDGGLENLLNTHDYFIYDYESCQRDFLTKAKMALDVFPGRINHWPLASLSCDSLWLGDEQAQTVWVFISGTHGVEGYCGSAAQRFLLDQLVQQNTRLPESCALLFIHALNPWGMQWARRCDQQGIDINRNFIDFSQLPAADPDYDKVLECLQLDGAQQRNAALATLRDAWGQTHFDRVFSGGQYQHAWAPFYGGQEAGFSQQIIDKMMHAYDLESKRLNVIDIHSGLGPWAYGQLISDHPAGSESNVWAKQLFSDWVAVTAHGESFSVPKAGLLDYHWHRLMTQEKSFFLTLEFGTLGSESLFSVLLDEHLYWKNCLNDDIKNEKDPAYQLQRHAMLHHFCPDNQQWQQAVLFQTWQVLARLISAYE
jgi:hypothetical protein